jgi:hypothetical protein
MSDARRKKDARRWDSLGLALQFWKGVGDARKTQESVPIKILKKTILKKTLKKTISEKKNNF